jgi:hypothetical protein
MADNNFRNYPGRDAIADEDELDPRDALRDPLAELARMIGQSDAAGEFARDTRRAPAEAYEEAAPATVSLGYADDDGYVEPQQYAEESYTQPEFAEPQPPARDYPRSERDDARYDERQPSLAPDYPASPEYRDDPRGHELAPPAYETRYRDEAVPRRSAGRQLPALPPQTDDEYETDGQWDDGQAYAAEQYDDQPAGRSRRSGLVVVLAVLGLVFMGAASAFAYRTIFGGALLPTLPPIIKASNGPNKIIPAPGGTSGQAAAANSGAGEKLVSREEQPVQVQPQNAPPRVVSTIPVLPAPSAAPAGAAAANASPFPPPPAPAVALPASTAPAPAAGSTEPKKVHTVLIHPEPSAGTNGPAGQASAPAAARPRATVNPVSGPAPKPAANAPLAIVPIAQGSAPPPPPPPRAQVARTEPVNAPLATAPLAAAPLATAPIATSPAASAASGGGYSVQVTSQRSEAEAQAAFRTLRAKYPGQLGNREPVIRRADLGEKGTYYRAMVGPFASSEAAAGMCSNLKAAGGACIVQRN